MTTYSVHKKIKAAVKKEIADLVIKNGQIIDVFNHDIIHADVAITDGIFVGIGQYDGHQVIDAQGKYIAPSFIDAHVHIESSLVPPNEFEKVVLPHGVTTIIADPHEIANVAGVEGIKYMLDSSDALDLNVYFMLPSCVPATPYENAGATIRANDLNPFYKHPRVLGLGEVMDYPSVLHTEGHMLEKIEQAISNNKLIDGHAAGLNTDGINAFMTSNIRTDHEAVSLEEAKMRLQRGMFLIIRQGSVAKDLPNLIGAVTPYNSRRCLFGTDDKHLDDLVNEGSINFNVELAIQQGLSPILAIQIASLNAAECYGLDRKGAIAPGYDADFLILDDLHSVQIEQVYAKGKRVAENGQHLSESINKNGYEIASNEYKSVMNSINTKPLSIEDFQIKCNQTTKANIIGIVPNSLITKHVIEQVNETAGYFVPSIENDQLKIAVIERHHRTGNIGLGIVKGLQLKSGAIATTIAHDSHNIIVCGTNDEDMLFAVNTVKQMNGGLVVVQNNNCLATLELPIAGLMSDRETTYICEKLSALKKALKHLGATEQFNPFLKLSFLALPVIPTLKITDKGLFDVSQFKPLEVMNINY